jgi:hypothetical protein
VSDSKISALDRKFLLNARKPFVEVGEMFGVAPEVVAERLGVLLSSEGVLSDRQEERLLLLEVADLKDEVLKRLRDVEDRDFAAVANVALRSMKTIGERLDSRRKLVDADLVSIGEAQARLFGKAFDKALTHIVQALSTDQSPELVDAVVSDGLRLAVRELEASVVES